MRILSIGNSFSQDAHRYLHGIAKADGVDIANFNLYIGGCPLSTHYRNMLSQDRSYTLEMHGESTRFHTSLDEALLSQDWDVVSLQQVSHLSVNYQNYQPYLSALAQYVRRCAPKAKLALHQTWAYADGSEKLARTGYASAEDMFRDIENAYAQAAAEIQPDIFIPSGAVFQALRAEGLNDHLHRDTFHASLGLGRYAVGLTWYAALTGRDISQNTFSDFDKEISQEHIRLAKACIAAVLSGCSK